MTTLALDTLTPMLLGEVKKAFSDPEWLFEIKYDGYRCLAEVRNGTAQLKSRNGSNMTAWFPEVVRALATLKGSHIFDGEIAVLDEVGRSDFNRLQDRAKRRRYVPGADRVAFIAFDLLAYSGKSILEWPLTDRKAALQRVLTPAPPSCLFLDHARGDGEWLYQTAVTLELEGIVAKKADSVYQPGVRSNDWLKIKRPGAVPAERFKR
jgi:bifunctional non-homologous end joining protein LigD